MSCVVCSQVFDATELRGHEVRQHRDCAFRCSCTKRFDSSQDLRKHSRSTGHAISAVYRLPGEEPFEIVPYAEAGAGVRARSRAHPDRSSTEDEDAADWTPIESEVVLVEMHPCEFQSPCRCERVDLDLILALPGEEYPRCFECAKPLRGLGVYASRDALDEDRLQDELEEESWSETAPGALSDWSLRCSDQEPGEPWQEFY